VYHDVGRRTYVQEKEGSLVEGPDIVVMEVVGLLGEMSSEA